MMRRIHDLPVGSTVLVVVVLVAAVAAHAGAWYFISRRLGLSDALASVLIGIAVPSIWDGSAGHTPCSAGAVRLGH